MEWVRDRNKIRGGIQNGQPKYTTHKMELHVPYSIYSEIPEEDTLWEQQKRYSRDCEEALRNERSAADRRKGMCGSYSHVCGDSTKNECIGIYVISKGKSALMFYDRHQEMRSKWGDRHLWARGYYVATVGNVNEETIRKYIQEQEENEKLEEVSR